MKDIENISQRNVRGKKTRNPGYEAGNHWVICDICASAIRAKDARFRWDNAVVCPDDWEPRHTQDFVRGRQDKIIPDEPIRPESDPLFVTAAAIELSETGNDKRLLGQWVEQTSGVGSQLNAVETDSNTMVIVGNDAVLLRSTDEGVTWNSLTSQFTADHVHDVAEDSGTWVIVGETGKRSYSTDDGLTWIANHDTTVTASELGQKWESETAGVNLESGAIVGDFIYALKDGDVTPDLFRYNKSDGTLDATVATGITILTSASPSYTEYNPDDDLLYVHSGAFLGTLELDGTGGTEIGLIPGQGTGIAFAGFVYVDGSFYIIRHDDPFPGNADRHYIEKRTADTNFTVEQTWEFTSLIDGFDDPDSGNLGPVLGLTSPKSIGYDPSDDTFILSSWSGTFNTHGVTKLDLSGATPVYVSHKWHLEPATDANGTEIIFDIPGNIFYKFDRNTTLHAHYWSDQSTPDYYGVKSNGSQWLTTGVSTIGLGIIEYTADPTSTWTKAVNGFTGEVRDIAHNGSMWVAVGESGALETSTDGITWVSRTSSFGSSNIYAVNFALGYFLAVGDEGKIAKSSDGITWTQQTSPFDTGHQVDDVYYNDAFWTAVSFSGEMAISEDGETWLLIDSGFGTTETTGVAYTDVEGVACGYDGKITTSFAPLI